LTKETHTTHNTERKAHTFHSRVINLNNVNFTGEQINTLALGPNYAVEKDPKHYINELIIGTENAIRQMETKMQNTFLISSHQKNQINHDNHHAQHSTQNISTQPKTNKYPSTKQPNNNESRQKQKYSPH
jgi:hypothetical protein